MNISTAPLNNFEKSVSLGLSVFKKEVPMSLVEHADKYYYMSAEGTYIEGRWTTLPFQVAPMNMMGNDEIKIYNEKKSARVGYTQRFKAYACYLVHHKKRNHIIYQPIDDSAEDFMKTHIDPMIRDIPVMRALLPNYNKKHKTNTIDKKTFTNKRQLWVYGGGTAANYRDKSVDAVSYDELSAFLPDIGKQGPATTQGDERLSLSVFPKSNRGSTPTIKGDCQISRACEDAETYFLFHLSCPHCDKLQSLKWGGKKEEFGFKWVDKGNRSLTSRTAMYMCEHCKILIENNQLHDMQTNPKAVWICENTGIRTKDGLIFFDKDGDVTLTPESVSVHIWSAYNTRSTWARLVSDFLKVGKDLGKLKTFVNTKLGETWDEDVGEKLDHQILYGRREIYLSQVPEGVLYITGGIDQQDDRIEFYVIGWGAGEEAWLLFHYKLYGDPASDEMKRKAGVILNTMFTRADGGQVRCNRWCWDSGGHYIDEVYQASKKHGLHWVIPIKGASIYGKPVADFPIKRNSKGVYLTIVGTDNAKDTIYSRLLIQQEKKSKATPGYFHFPMDDDIAPESFFEQLTTERKILEFKKGKRVYRYDAGGRRNEALDCFVYALAALRISQEKFGINLALLSAIPIIKIKKVSDKTNVKSETSENKKATNTKSNSWLGEKKDPWL